MPKLVFTDSGKDMLMELAERLERVGVVPPPPFELRGPETKQ